MAIEINETKSFGPSGLAEVRVLANKVKVIFQADGDIYELPIDGWPSGQAAGNYFVGLTKDRNKVAMLRPVAGTYIAQFSHFKAPKAGELPEPTIQRGGPRKSKDGGTWYADDEWRYSAVIKVVEGPYAGVEAVTSIPYIFTNKQGSNEALMAGKPTQVKRNEKFLRCAGLDFMNDTIFYSPNVLPQLERLLQEKNAYFTVTINQDGFVDEMSPLPAGYVPATVTKKPAAKKAK